MIKWTNSVGMKIGVYLWVCGALFIEFIYLSSKRVKAFDILFVFAYRLWFWFSPCQCISRSMRERVLHVTWHSFPRTTQVIGTMKLGVNRYVYYLAISCYLLAITLLFGVNTLFSSCRKLAINHEVIAWSNSKEYKLHCYYFAISPISWIIC